jgi:hypothetical protein
MDEQYEDPRNDSSQGRWVSGENADAGPRWEPLTIATPRGEYLTTNYESGEGYYNEYTPEQMASAAAKIEADRQAKLAMALGILADNPLSVTGDQIQTRYGDRNVSMFYPIAAKGEPVTGETPAQLVDPQTGTPVFLSDPNDPFSYTYDRTDTPAISGTVAQQAALYRPLTNKGVFGTLGGDLLDAVKDPYFHKFAAAAAAMAGGAALAAQSAGGAAGGTGVGTAAGGTGGTGISSAAGGLGLKMPTATSLASMGGGTGLIVPAGTNALSVGALGAGGLGTLGAGGLGNITAKQALSAARLALPAIRAIAGAGGDSDSAANQRRLANQFSGGNQGVAANQFQVKSSPLTKIDYLYDIGGESIFAPMREKKLPDSDIGLYADGGLVSFNEGGDVTQEELEAALRPVTYNQKLAAYGEQRREQRPEKEISADEAMLAEIAAGFHPVLGPALSAKDFEEARGENNYLGMGLAGLGMIPVLGGAIKGYNRLVRPALQRRAAQRADAEMVERYGKIPAGEPVPEGYFGGPPVNRDRVSLLDTADQDNYYSSPKFQTQYGKEFTHDLVHGSPSSEVMAFNPRAFGAPDALARESSLYFNPLLTARRSADDTTTFLSPDAMYSDQYLPTIASNAPTGYGFPIPKKEYKEGATMYPVSARLGKLFDPESKDALNVAEEFLGTIHRPKDMSAKDFDRNISDLKKLLKNGDPKVIESPDFSNFLKERGYDSFAFIKKGKGEQVKNYGVFEPSRIRGKFAEFNPEYAESTEIMKAEGGLIEAGDLQTIDDLYEMLRSK